MTQATTITLQDVKDFLRVTHDQDDDMLTRLLVSAQQEALRFLGRTELPTLPLEYPVDYDGGTSSEEVTEEVPSSDDEVAPDVVTAVLLFVQADYDGDPAQRMTYRSASESLLMPYRIGLGI